MAKTKVARGEKYIYLYANSTYEVRYCKPKDLKRNIYELFKIASNIKVPIMILKDGAEFDTKLFDKGNKNVIRAIAVKYHENGECEVYLNNIFRKKEVEIPSERRNHDVGSI